MRSGILSPTAFKLVPQDAHSLFDCGTQSEAPAIGSFVQTIADAPTMGLDEGFQ